jgi:hypothetical protein
MVSCHHRSFVRPGTLVLNSGNGVDWWICVAATRQRVSAESGMVWEALVVLEVSCLSTDWYCTKYDLHRSHFEMWSCPHRACRAASGASLSKWCRLVSGSPSCYLSMTEWCLLECKAKGSNIYDVEWLERCREGRHQGVRDKDGTGTPLVRPNVSQ